MAKTYNRMNIEIGKPINSIGIHPVEGDTNSRYLDVSLYNNGVPINLTGERVRINFLKENGLSFFNQGEITDAAAGRCQFALTNDVLSEAEELKAQISIWGIGGEILSTETFNIYVSENIRCDEAVEGTNEFGVLVVLFQEIQNALDLMQRISDGFGEPGEKAAEYGVSTFWQILEVFAGRTDVQTVLQNIIPNYVKTALHSDAGNSGCTPLNTIMKTGGVPIIRHIQRGVVTLKNGAATVSLSGFSNLNKMIVLINGNGHYTASSSNYPSSENYAAESYGGYSQEVHFSDLTVSSVRFLQSGFVEKTETDSRYWGSENAVISYQIIEFY